jgi:hypothetical protein
LGERARGGRERRPMGEGFVIEGRLAVSERERASTDSERALLLTASQSTDSEWTQSQ